MGEKKDNKAADASSEDVPGILYAVVAHKRTVLAECTSSKGNFPTATRLLLAKIQAGEEETRQTYEYDSYSFHFLGKDEMTYLCMAPKAFDRRIAFLFLDRVKVNFIARFGDKGKVSIAFAMNASFSPILQQLMARYSAPQSLEKILDIKAELKNVEQIASENVEKVLERGDKIELLVERTDRLADQAATFRNKSGEVRTMMARRNRLLLLLAGSSALLLGYAAGAFFCGLTLQHCL